MAPVITSTSSRGTTRAGSHNKPNETMKNFATDALTVGVAGTGARARIAPLTRQVAS
jgi:hypothetical protein